MIKKIIKFILDILSFMPVVSPILVVRVFNVQSRYDDFAVLMAYLPFYLGERARYFFYKMTLEAVGREVRFKFGSWVQYRTVKIGSNVLIGYFNSIGWCEIGDDVLFGGNVNVMSGLKQHNFIRKDKKIIEQGGRRSKICIGDDVYVGSGSIIATNLAKGVVVAAGSLIVNETEPYTVYVGNKSVKIKTRK